MKRRFDDMTTWGGSEPHADNTYDYPTMDSSDDEIEAFIEQERSEFYRAWYSYVRDFE